MKPSTVAAIAPSSIRICPPPRDLKPRPREPQRASNQTAAGSSGVAHHPFPTGSWFIPAAGGASGHDQRAGAMLRKEFEEHRMRRLAIEDDDALDTPLDCLDTGFEDRKSVVQGQSIHLVGVRRI